VNLPDAGISVQGSVLQPPIDGTLQTEVAVSIDMDVDVDIQVDAAVDVSSVVNVTRPRSRGRQSRLRPRVIEARAV
jgi:hypothetical protein